MRPRSPTAALRLLSSVAPLGIAAFAVPAHADLFVPMDDGGVSLVERRALIAPTGRSELLWEESELISTARRFLWLKPFPNEPELVTPPATPFARLPRLAHVETPYNQLLRRDVFGPSVVTILAARLWRPEPPSDPPEAEPRRSLVIAKVEIFSGQVSSSSTAGALLLPTGLATWLSEQGIELNHRRIVSLAATLNQGWPLMAAIVDDPAPSEDQPALLGGVGFRFRTRRPILPMSPHARSVGAAVPFEFFFVSDRSIASTAHETVWDVRPWEGITVPGGQFRVRYHHPVEPDSPIAIELKETLGLNVPESAVLTWMDFEHPRGRWRSLAFDRPRDPVEIPGGVERGDLIDLFLCVLLGLTPLLYTPESWFLLWLSNRARSDGRVRLGTTAARLWSLFAIVVGLYWFWTLPSAGSVAGVVPIIVGLFSLLSPLRNRVQSPIRVQFKKRKSAAT